MTVGAAWGFRVMETDILPEAAILLAGKADSAFRTAFTITTFGGIAAAFLAADR